MADRVEELAWRRILWGSTLERFGAAATFTGLPFWLAEITGDPRHVGGLFLVQASVAMLLTLVSGHLADRFRRKHVVIAGCAVGGGALLAQLAWLGPDTAWVFYAAGAAVAIVDALMGSSMQLWVASLIPEGELLTWSGRRGTVLSGAKLAGTFLGPLLFTWLGQTALWLDAATLFLAAALYATAFDPHPPTATGSGGPAAALRSIADGVQVAMRNPGIRRMVALYGVAGLLAMPLTAASVTLLVAHGAGELWVSTFWGVAFGANLLANALIGTGRLERLETRRLLAACFGAVFVAVLCIASAPVPALLVVAFASLVVPRTIANQALFARVFPMLRGDSAGRVIAVCDVVFDLGGLVGMLATTAGTTQGPAWVSGYAAVGCALAAALLLTWRAPAPTPATVEEVAP